MHNLVVSHCYADGDGGDGIDDHDDDDQSDDHDKYNDEQRMMGKRFGKYIFGSKRVYPL